MAEENAESTTLVTADHCKQVSLRVEGKVDLNTDAVNNLADKLEPKLEMIVRLDSTVKFAKGVILFLCGSGFLAGVYKLSMMLFSKK